MIAWAVGGMFFVTWAYVGLWGGIFFCAIPWASEILYILYEWPLRQSNEAWKFVFYSAEFFLIFMQGTFWLVSMLIHIILL